MSSKPFLSIAPIGKGNYKPKLNETITEENLKNGVWEINTSKLLNEVRNEITEQEKETGYIESDFFPIKKQQNLTWANRTPNSKMASPVQTPFRSVAIENGHLSAAVEELKSGKVTDFNIQESNNTKKYIQNQPKNRPTNQPKNQNTSQKSRKNRKTRKSSRRRRMSNKSQRKSRK
jgi:hypothetical protein